MNQQNQISLPMHQDFWHLKGLLGMASTIILFWISKDALQQIAGLATIFAGFSTGIYYLYSTFKPSVEKIKIRVRKRFKIKPKKP